MLAARVRLCQFPWYAHVYKCHCVWLKDRHCRATAVKTVLFLSTSMKSAFRRGNEVVICAAILASLNFSLHREIRPNPQFLRIARARGLAQPSYRAGAGDSMLATAFFLRFVRSISRLRYLAQSCVVFWCLLVFPKTYSPCPFVKARCCPVA